MNNHAILYPLPESEGYHPIDRCYYVAGFYECGISFSGEDKFTIELTPERLNDVDNGILAEGQLYKRHEDEFLDLRYKQTLYAKYATDGSYVDSELLSPEYDTDTYTLQVRGEYDLWDAFTETWQEDVELVREGMIDKLESVSGEKRHAGINVTIPSEVEGEADKVVFFSTEKQPSSDIKRYALKTLTNGQVVVHWKHRRGNYEIYPIPIITKIFNAMTDYINSVYEIEREKHELLVDAVDPRSVDLETGWPSQDFTLPTSTQI